ncbi:hypothetical protein FRC18_010552 [Serendipita sp. 400]|nr:hypothetical protein FRC18_010552 [Serendipita sp. 400]
MNRLSHLHLDSIYAHSQKACRLDLPHLVHLELDLHLGWMSPEGFPLEIHMPHVKTLSLDGYVGPRFAHEVEEFILLAKSSIVNLLISVRHCFVLDLERLTEFPRLSTFGINLSSLTRSVHQELSTIPPPNLTSSLSLIVLGLDDHHRQTSEPRLLWAAHFVKLLSTHRGWFSEIIVPIAWRELGELWVQSSEMFDASDIPFNEDDPLPCLWSCLDYIEHHQPLLILDRNRVSLREGDGAVFAKRMQTYMEDERYRQRRREYSASKADDTENVWIIDPWETRDWEP